METTITFLKQNGLTVAALLVLLYLQTDMGDDIRVLGEDLKAIRAEMAAGFREVQAEMVKGERAIRAEMAESDQTIHADISALGERMARVETRLAGAEIAVAVDIDENPRAVGCNRIVHAVVVRYQV